MSQAPSRSTRRTLLDPGPVERSAAGDITDRCGSPPNPAASAYSMHSRSCVSREVPSRSQLRRSRPSRKRSLSCSVSLFPSSYSCTPSFVRRPHAVARRRTQRPELPEDSRPQVVPRLRRRILCMSRTSECCRAASVACASFVFCLFGSFFVPILFDPTVALQAWAAMELPPDRGGSEIAACCCRRRRRAHLSRRPPKGPGKALGIRRGRRREGTKSPPFGGGWVGVDRLDGAG